jgi:cysteine desulfurase
VKSALRPPATGRIVGQDSLAAMHYFDHAATTPLDPEVFEEMLPFFREQFGNPSSVHALGRRARLAVEDARDRVAAVLGCEPAEVIFTGGGTEADQLAIAGVLEHPSASGARLVTSAAEHDAVLQAAASVAARGHPVTRLAPTPDGGVDPDALDAALAGGDVGLVSLMWVNNELGTIAPLAEVAARCRQRGVPLHSDAVQAAAVLPLAVDDHGADLLSLSGHKLYGPKGVGVLYVRGGTPLAPLVVGGGQERGRRGGTENVAGVVGMAAALERAASRAGQERARLASLNERLRAGVAARLGDRARINTPSGDAAAPHILNVSFPPAAGRALDGEMLLLALDMAGIAASSGSACASGAVQPSHVLEAIGLGRETARATVRLSMGRATDEAAVDAAVDALAAAVERQRG